MVSGPALIKGYLPLRVSLPSRNGDTFLFLKQHISGPSHDNNSSTLFVTNVPFVPGVHTKLFLQELFGRFGNVANVVVVRNPRSKTSWSPVSGDGGNESIQVWKELVESSQGWFNDEDDEGKFAHITFTSNKEMKKALRVMQSMSIDMDKKKKKGKDVGANSRGEEAAAVFGTLLVQNLVDQSKRLKKNKNCEEGGTNSDNFDSDMESDGESVEREGSEKLTGILALAERCRSRIISRDVLMNRCNAVMENFEAEEEADRMARTANAEPDEDGFITVSHGPSVGSKRELDEDPGGRKKGSKRSRKKKGNNGASELTDFYRFQQRETKKKSLQELRKRFEEDLAAVKKLKEQKMYRPF
mmetsp:Transcript_36138/g.52976  ORF Transcript_36138/g.52976 Transcript_36138/m.52976 type:complete len:357 (+) Transcript_36138:104-1174(+)|eukprot:CAMPEP_0195521960 /NCGR_PEP_ID=MMETSP0794_2-20130614/19771_1 /TAXON_ID=515487 /ORGANISM="Stephanopyxis turris, Strain CCMP 815" /LENGTH=356 /DNA_ID=CAMNT_0040651625 /DNA_START=90 /DNA_END=1160 /DNA_ORIENTATION=-